MTTTDPPLGDAGLPDGRGFDAVAAVAGLRGISSDWPDVVHLATVDSTNRAAAHAANTGAAPWTIVVADRQTAGRGRLGRHWDAETGTALLASIILRPPGALRHDCLAWVPLMLGMAAVEAVRDLGVSAWLKWPNDVMVPEAGTARPLKLGGVLVEAHWEPGPLLVAGIGINTTMSAEQLPVPDATSLELAGASDCDAASLLVRIMAMFRPLWDTWLDAGGDAVRCGLKARYEADCTTIGRDVTVGLPDGRSIRGKAVGVDREGHLQVQTTDGTVVVASGDVTHVRY